MSLKYRFILSSVFSSSIIDNYQLKTKQNEKDFFLHSNCLLNTKFLQKRRNGDQLYNPCTNELMTIYGDVQFRTHGVTNDNNSITTVNEIGRASCRERV